MGRLLEEVKYKKQSSYGVAMRRVASCCVVLSFLLKYVCVGMYRSAICFFSFSLDWNSACEISSFWLRLCLWTRVSGCTGFSGNAWLFVLLLLSLSFIFSCCSLVLSSY